MKRILFIGVFALSIILFIAFSCIIFYPYIVPEGVEINEENFPDAKFREYLMNNNFGRDRVITDKEILYVTRIKVNNFGIADLSGIEVFANLKELECDGNQLSQLDLRNLKNLELLSCRNNQLTALNLDENIALTKLECHNNQLNTLDLTNNVNLVFVDCDNNQISYLNVTTCAVLKYLFCSNNNLDELDVSKNAKLYELECKGNNFKYLNIASNKELTKFRSDFKEFYPPDDRVKEGMTRTQVESIWGAPAQTSVKVYASGTLTYCWYYDSNGDYRMVIYNYDNIVGAVL